MIRPWTSRSATSSASSDVAGSSIALQLIAENSSGPRDSRGGRDAFRRAEVTVGSARIGPELLARQADLTPSTSRGPSCDRSRAAMMAANRRRRLPGLDGQVSSAAPRRPRPAPRCAHDRRPAAPTTGAPLRPRPAPRCANVRRPRPAPTSGAHVRRLAAPTSGAHDRRPAAPPHTSWRPSSGHGEGRPVRLPSERCPSHWLRSAS
jgi:hypothetical protein